MGLRPGYKQTEVGVIPEDWDAGSLTRYWAVTDCKHVTAQFVADGYPIASIREVQSRFVNLSNAKQTSQRYYDLLTEGNRKPRAGDLILSRNATVGEVAQVAECHLPFALGQDVCLLRKRSAQFSADYLQAVFGSTVISNQLSDFMVGSTFKRVNVEQIKSLAVPMPPPPEQEAIAEALSDADALIESLEELLTKKRQLKQGAMQDLLTGKKRLCDSISIRRKQTEIGLLPADWAVRRISEVANVKTGPFGSSLHERDYVDFGTPIITVEHLGERGVEHRNLPMVSDSDCRRLKAYALEEGDIVFSRVGSVDRNAFVSRAERGWLFSGRLLRLRATSQEVDTRFLSYQFHSQPFKQRVITVAVGQTMASLNTQILNKVLVAMPPRPEQIAIAAVLFDIDADIAALEAKLSKARLLKLGMMHELLTGKIRLV